MCDACTSSTDRDITEDRVTLQFLAISKFPPTADKKEKAGCHAHFYEVHPAWLVCFSSQTFSLATMLEVLT